MKFVFVAPRFHTNQYEIVKTLQNNGHDVEFNVVEIGHTEDHSLLMPKLYEPCFLSKLAIKQSKKEDAFLYKSFPNPFKYFFDLKNSKADFVVLRNPNRYFSLLSAICARLLGIKVIFYSLTPLHQKYSESRRIITNLLLSLFDAVWMTPIEGNKVKHEFYPKGMFFIPFAVPQWANSVKQVDEIPKLLMVARLQKRKNYLLFLEAINDLKNRYDFSVTLIGKCTSESQKIELEKVTDYITQHNLEKIVDIQLNVPFSQIQEYYKSHDLFVLPARDEPAGISILEALSCGLPVICSTTCGTRFYVEKGFNGQIFQCEVLEDLIEKIEYCLKDNNVLSKMKENGFNNSLKTITGKAYYKAFSNMIFEKWKIKI